MIVRESEEDFYMITQHDHARLAGDIARNIRDQFFIDAAYRDDVLLAVYQHDRSWIPLDDIPLWNDKNSVPFSFDFPLLPKIILYKHGIDQVEAMNKYSALLCSLHYSSFQVFHDSSQKECSDFYLHESERQEKLKNEYPHINKETILSHFRLLQLCDHFSLYVCLNHAGATKENEHPQYRSGFQNSEFFNTMNRTRLGAFWKNDKEIEIIPSPFATSFKTTLPVRKVSKEKIKNEGIADAFKETEPTEQEVTFLNNH